MVYCIHNEYQRVARHTITWVSWSREGFPVRIPLVVKLRAIALQVPLALHLAFTTQHLAYAFGTARMLSGPEICSQ